MKKLNLILLIILFVSVVILISEKNRSIIPPQNMVMGEDIELNTEKHWFILYRKSNQEKLFFGIPGEIGESKLLKTFQVKSGIPRERPTPLPQLLGREYWLIVDKFETFDSLETAPYFLSLDIPVSDVEPFGPTSYLECNGQCNWIIPGFFGLHGTSGNIAKISREDPGSSGCIRHSDEDITYLYNLLDPKREEIRYYIEDS